jgi:hypothetical protein
MDHDEITDHARRMEEIVKDKIETRKINRLARMN